MLAVVFCVEVILPLLGLADQVYDESPAGDENKFIVVLPQTTPDGALADTLGNGLTVTVNGVDEVHPAAFVTVISKS
jgi:hypothetical protein